MGGKFSIKVILTYTLNEFLVKLEIDSISKLKRKTNYCVSQKTFFFSKMKE